jgi:uncharacterized protein YggE
MAKPNTVEFRLRISGTGELASDAMAKYLDHRRRTLAAIAQLKLKELKTESHGISVAYASDSQMEPDAIAAGGTPRPSLQFSSIVRLALSGIRDQQEDKILEVVSQLIDRLRDLEVQLIPPSGAENLISEDDSQSNQPIVIFVLDDVTELREQAYRKAFVAARTNAERLAKLASVKLGPVVALDDLQMQDYGATMAMNQDDPAAGETGFQRIASHKFASVPVRVTVQVRFSIQK